MKRNVIYQTQKDINDIIMVYHDYKMAISKTFLASMNKVGQSEYKNIWPCKGNTGCPVFMAWAVCTTQLKMHNGEMQMLEKMEWHLYHGEKWNLRCNMIQG